MRSLTKFDNDINCLEGDRYSGRPSTRHPKGKTLVRVPYIRLGLGLAACEGLFRLKINQKEPKAELTRRWNHIGAANVLCPLDLYDKFRGNFIPIFSFSKSFKS
jgi:hypothetical protein